MNEHILYLSEQQFNEPVRNISNHLKSLLVKPSYKLAFHYKPEMVCFDLCNTDQQFTVNTNYFVGIGWLERGKAAVYVEPKLNDVEQVDYLGMLLESLSDRENGEHLDNLFHVDYDSPWINIPEQKDRLSPILIVQFLKLVEHIVRKGLRKSYYHVTENLNSRIKGKILVGQQIKKNVARNRITHTVCKFQEYGIDTPENQFLKLVLEFVSAYLSRHYLSFDAYQRKRLHGVLDYCKPSFQLIKSWEQKHERPFVQTNVFYKEYEQAIKIGGYILQRFSFNINKASQNITSTPAFWIDMSKLFELYVFGKLKKLFTNPEAITYHDNFRGRKQTDILVRERSHRCVIDCKYKPRYQNQDPSLEDKRQLAGYTRLKSVYNKLNVAHNEIIKGLIVYSSQYCKNDLQLDDLFSNPIEEYNEFYKLGIRLPVL